jgi:hypothetical protein
VRRDLSSVRFAAREPAGAGGGGAAGAAALAGSILRERGGVTDVMYETPALEETLSQGDLAQHFAVTYMRIGLPEPYATEP